MLAGVPLARAQFGNAETERFRGRLERLVESGKLRAAIGVGEAWVRAEEGRPVPFLEGLRDALSALSAVHRTLGEHKQALQLMHRELKLWEDRYGAAPSDGYASGQIYNLLSSLGEYYASLGLAESAESFYRRALALNLSPGALNNLGAFYGDLDRFADAEKMYRDAIELAARDGGGDDAVLSILNNLGVILVRQGRALEAEQYYLRAYKGRRKDLDLDGLIKGPPIPSSAGSDTGVAILELQAPVSNLADLYERLGRYADAEKYAQLNVDVLGKLSPPGLHLADALQHLAKIKQGAHRYKDALPLLRRAVAIGESRIGKDSPVVAGGLLELGRVLHKLGRDRDAQDTFRKAVNIIARDAKLAQSFEPFAQKTPFDMVLPVTVAWRLARSTPEDEIKLRSEAFAWAQWGMQAKAGKAISQMAARFGGLGAPWSKLVRERQDLTLEWEHADKRLIEAVNAGGSRSEKTVARIRKERAALEDRLDKLSATIKREFPAYFELASAAPLDIPEVRRLLKADEALVLLLSGAAEQTFIFALTPDKATWKRIEIGRKELADRISAFRKPLDVWAGPGRGLARLAADECVPGPGKDGRGLARLDPACEESRGFSLARAHDLYRDLLGPVEDVIKDRRHLIFVASGPVTALPFHLLVTAPPGAARPGHNAFAHAPWLIRRHAVSVLPAASALRALRVHAKRSRAVLPFLGFGDPDFDRGSAPMPVVAMRGISSYFRGGLADLDAVKGTLPPLPDTATELRAIALTLGAAETDVILRGRATESALKAMSADGRLARYRVLAFATHGLVAGEIKGLAEPSIVLSLPAKATEADDGFLTASEAAQLKLDADWIVLSACNTAAGDTPNAEALSGLARGFFFAGARALLVSHWPVESRAAVKLTTRAFAALNANPKIGRAEALRQSMLAMIEQGEPYESHPAYWAPFVLVGEGGVSEG
jgi:CHAT domain-containing protein/tetratricopeptide (TPR) repeat protein